MLDSERPEAQRSPLSHSQRLADLVLPSWTSCIAATSAPLVQLPLAMPCHVLPCNTPDHDMLRSIASRCSSSHQPLAPADLILKGSQSYPPVPTPPSATQNRVGASGISHCHTRAGRQARFYPVTRDQLGQWRGEQLCHVVLLSILPQLSFPQIPLGEVEVELKSKSRHPGMGCSWMNFSSSRLCAYVLSHRSRCRCRQAREEKVVRRHCPTLPCHVLPIAVGPQSGRRDT